MTYQITKIKFLKDYNGIKAGHICKTTSDAILCGCSTFQFSEETILQASREGLVQVYAKVQSD